MILSDRILKVKPSPTLGIAAMANAMRAKGIDVISFSTGEPDFDTPKFIKDAAIKAIEAGKTKYTPAGGIPELKKAIIQKLKRDENLDYKMSEVTVNCGGKHSCYNLMQVLLNEGDEVIIPAPYWVSYPPIVLLAGGKPVIVDTKEENGFKMTPGDLEKRISKKTRAIIINSPSNPTGSTYSKADLERIGDIIIKHKILVVSDDMYNCILYDGVQPSNMASLSDELKKLTLVLNGVSKAYSMTGWRIGYPVGRGNDHLITLIQ